MKNSKTPLSPATEPGPALSLQDHCRSQEDCHFTTLSGLFIAMTALNWLVCDFTQNVIQEACRL
jgi:hypothetical protein